MVLFLHEAEQVQSLQEDYKFLSLFCFSLAVCVIALLIAEWIQMLFLPTVVKTLICSSSVKQGIMIQYYFTKLYKT